MAKRHHRVTQAGIRHQKPPRLRGTNVDGRAGAGTAVAAMRIGGGIERWMVMVPVVALAILVTVYVGGPERALDLLERLAYGVWDRSVLLLRR